MILKVRFPLLCTVSRGPLCVAFGWIVEIDQPGSINLWQIEEDHMQLYPDSEDKCFSLLTLLKKTCYYSLNVVLKHYDSALFD